MGGGMLSKLYLTIDDSPSIHMNKKVDFLMSKNIPAICSLDSEALGSD